MIMEIVEGGEMFVEVVDNGGLPFDDRGPEGKTLPGARSYARQILLGLAYCHKRSIAHRDIKLENLLLSGDRQTCKIADFGLAKISTGGLDMTILGTIKCVPACRYNVSLAQGLCCCKHRTLSRRSPRS
jgi:serine/threonine protein kinase